MGGTAQVRVLTRIPIVGSMLGEVVTTMQVLNIDNLIESPYSDLHPLESAGMRSVVAVPLLVGPSCLGTVNMASSKEAAFDSRHYELLGSIADLIASSLGLQQMAEQARQKAMVDDLTQVLNRGAILAELDSSVETVGKTDGRLSMLYIDLDNFKATNDTFGHDAGDYVLRSLAKRIETLLDPEDRLGRLGGDEFLVLLDGPEAGERARNLAAAILRSCRQPIDFQGRNLHVAVSIGVSSLGNDVTSAIDLLADADRAMYTAKNSGVGLSIASATTRKDTAVLATIDRELQSAMDSGALCFHYQPVASLKTGQIVGAEALLRWNHEHVGMISPQILVDRVEATGYVEMFTRWCLQTAARDLARLHVALPERAELKFGINLSPRQLSLVTYPELHRDICLDHDLEPNDVMIEIVESATIKPNSQAETTLRNLADLGVAIALDDFGAGHNVLSYFTRFPIQFLKFDRSLVAAITKSPAAYKILKALTSMSNELGVRTLAEGIESEDELAMCSSLGIPFGQGWHISRPKPLAELIELVDGAPEPRRSPQT